MKAGYPNHLDYEGLTGSGARAEVRVEGGGSDLAERGPVGGVDGVREGRKCRI